MQVEIARRQSLGRSYSGSSIFASKLVCGDCGGFYGKKVWHSTDAYRREIWRCNGKFDGEAKCETRMQRDRELRIFISSIKEQPLVLETWDEGLWLTLLETATVHADNIIIFRFKDGTDIEVGAE